MALFNYATRELSAKIVYYGPGLSGKTTNIDMVHRLLKPDQKGRLISLPTETDRTLFFDFLPVDLGHIKGFKVRFHLYTVPGQVFYNATRRLVLQGVDGVVFVADSQVDMAQGNEESLKNLNENLTAYGKKLDDLPFVLQYNKRDLSRISSVGEMNARLNRMNAPVIEGIAKDGVGVSETLVTISRMVFSHLRKSLMLPGDVEREEERPAPEAKVEAKAASPRVVREEPLEEISEIEDIEEIEEIQEVREVQEIQEDREIREVPPEAAARETAGELESPGAEEPWEVDRELTVAGEGPAAAEVRETFPVWEETEPEPPGAAEPVPEEFEILPGAPPIAEAEALSGGAAIPREEEIEIDIPSPPPENIPGKDARAVISAETASGDLTFLKFEPPHISPEGDAVLPAMFMDGEGNIVRIRIRIRMEE